MKEIPVPYTQHSIIFVALKMIIILPTKCCYKSICDDNFKNYEILIITYTSNIANP